MGVMLTETDSFRQGLETATQHLETLRQATSLDALRPDQQGARQGALDGLAAVLLVLKQAYDVLAQQNEASTTRCQDLEKERAYYRDLFEHVPHASLLTDLSGAIQGANAPAATLLRASQDALTGQLLAAFLPEPERHAFGHHLAQLQTGGVLQNWQAHLQGASGEPVPVSLDAVPVRDQERRVVGLHWLLSDVSAGKRAAEREELLRQVEQDHRAIQGLAADLQRERDIFQTLLENTAAQVAYLDAELNFVAVNSAYARGSGHRREELIGRNHFDLFPSAENQAVFERVRDTGQPAQFRAKPFEFADQPARGTTYWDWSLVPVMDAAGKVEGLVLSLVDVTEEVHAAHERERLLADNRTQREFLEQLVEAVPVGIAVLRGADYRFQLANPYYQAITGASDTPMIGRTFAEVFPQLTAQGLPQLLDAVYQIGQTVSSRELKLSFGPGREETYWNTDRVPLRGPDGAVDGILILAREVTEEVQARRRIEALSTHAQRQAAELNAVLNAIPESVAVWDAQGTLLRANPASTAFGIGPAGTQVAHLAEHVRVRYPDGGAMPPAESVVAQTLRGETVVGQREAFVTATGAERELVASGAPVVSGGQVVAAVVVTHDVTEERRGEKERERLLAENRAQREFLERLLEVAPVGIAVLRGEDHRYELANPYYRAMTGDRDRPMVGRTIVEAIPDLPARKMPPLLDQVYRTGQTVSTHEVQLSIGPGREETYWNTERVPLKSPEGTVEGILVLAQEVTDQVLARRRIEALSAQAQRQADEMAAVVAALVEPVMVFDAQANIVQANPAAIDWLGVNPVGLPEGTLGQKMRACYPDGRPIPARDLVANRALRGERVQDDYQLLVTPARGERTIVASSAPIVTGGEVKGAVIAWHDITDLQRVEAALRESEEKLRMLFELMPIGVSVLDRERRLVAQNAALANILGLSREGLLHGDHLARTYLRSDGTAMPPDEFPSARALREQRLVHDLIGVTKEDGTMTWTDVSAAPVPFADWTVVVATVDVTERKEAEAALRRARDELEQRIKERTAELERANQMLVAEIRERARVEGELRQSEQRLEQRVNERTRELSTLLDISNTVALSMELEPLLALILERLRDVVDYDGGAAFKLDSGTLNPVFHRGDIPPDHLLRIGSHLEEAVLGRVAIAGTEQVILADVQGEPALQEAFRQATGAHFEKSARVVRAWMTVPVTIKQQVYGMLYMYHSQPGRYGEEQARLALPFGNQAAVAIENVRLYQQAQRLAAVEERQRLARELHDAVTQTLFSASLAAEVLPRLWERDRDAGLRCLSEVHQLTRGALAEMRTLLLELRPAALVETNLGALLHQLGEAFTSRTRIQVSVQAVLHCTLPPEVQVAMYRIAQEALNNVMKHAQARHVDIRLQSFPLFQPGEGRALEAGVELCVVDDGRGFDPGLLVGVRGLGLGIMRERAAAIGAALQIQSQPGLGTSITLRWPDETGDLPPVQSPPPAVESNGGS